MPVNGVRLYRCSDRAATAVGNVPHTREYTHLDEYCGIPSNTP